MYNIQDKLVLSKVTNNDFADWFFREPRVVSFINPVSYLLLRRSLTPKINRLVLFTDGILATVWLSLLKLRRLRRLSFDFTSVADPFL